MPAAPPASLSHYLLSSSSPLLPSIHPLRLTARQEARPRDICSIHPPGNPISSQVSVLLATWEWRYVGGSAILSYDGSGRGSDLGLTSRSMYTSSQKIHKDKDAEPTEFEENVAQVAIELVFYYLLVFLDIANSVYSILSADCADEALVFDDVTRMESTPQNPQFAGRSQAHVRAEKGKLGVPQLPGQGCSFHSFRTNTYKLSFMESPSGIKLILVTHPRTSDLRDSLKYIYNLYVEYVVKNPLYSPGSPIRLLGRSSLINFEQSLTEPYVGRKIFETIRCGSSLFYGNSMPIRDADMFETITTTPEVLTNV
ncbi:trafficking protein particle complex subunit 1 [Phtheirospermum japonicum]|uniref:Trafficking protein particle complex subunit 1 n=1 Tax=Phtheirospermum japonicum TaxID=374723 RepID=A0A830D535_9LAMI|nr:trafficking protein particle complex subunit 1 [Phtheirospermum japonicum]